MNGSRSYTVGIVLAVVVVVLTITIVIYLITRYEYSVNGTPPFASGATVRIRSLATGGYLYTDGTVLYSTGTATTDAGLFILTQQTAATSQGYYYLSPRVNASSYLSGNCGTGGISFTTDLSLSTYLQFNLISAYQPTVGSPVQAGVGSAYQISAPGNQCAQPTALVNDGGAINLETIVDSTVLQQLFTVLLA